MVVRTVFLTLSLCCAAAFPQPGPNAHVDSAAADVSPREDFYQYACGNWMKSSEIPADRSSWQSFSELDERNLDIERGILEKAATGGASRNPIDQKIGDLYGSCMDEKTVNAKGIAPLQPEQVDAIHNLYARQLATLERQNVDVIPSLRESLCVAHHTIVSFIKRVGDHAYA